MSKNMKFQIEHSGHNIIHLDETDDISPEEGLEKEDYNPLQEGLQREDYNPLQDYMDFVNIKNRATTQIGKIRKNIHNNMLRDTKKKKKKNKLTDEQKDQLE